ncbi:SusC/RagA family TonB-linked outer membrane protein [Pedobacter psychrodurus]|uniref:SusC/RagA family TonB-linked outer membrane protein n=1 Tax=Pedobacter psychrodurus TaxID=2530456 RepID=UPI00292D9074|nr:SusC/RagA family TonB-linked outer membrane protein [Pedobacter psychrodurus]
MNKSTFNLGVPFNWLRAKIFMAMKITTFLVLAICMQVSASTFGQNITLSQKNVSLIETLNKIKQLSGYDVLYGDDILPKAKNVSLSLSNVTLDIALEEIFKGQDLTYSIGDKTIVIKKKDPGFLDRLINRINAVEIRGKVLDEKGSPMSSVSIKPKSGGRAVYTNSEGAFAIDVENSDAILIFSYVGYVSRELPARNNMSVTMQPDVSNLEQVVVTGYTQKKASELTGSVQSISGETLRNGVSTVNGLAMLKGVAAGLYIVEQGGSVANRGQVVLRGQSSFNDASNTNYGPLIVIDGVITNAANLQDIIDPQDIESINILRDAASTAIYGSRAAQGVIVVVTKRGSVGKTKINFGANYGKVQNNRAIRFMNTSEATAHITKYMQALYTGTASLRTTYPTFDQYFNATRIFSDADLAVNTEWDNNAFFTDGNQSDINLSISSGTDKTRFYTALNWNKQDGTLLDDGVSRKSIRVNVDQKITDKLTFSLNTNAILDNYTATNSENQYYLFQPWVSPNYANGTLADSISNYTYRATGARLTQYYDNPLYSHEYNTVKTNRLNLMGTGILKYAVTPWLSLQSSNTINYNNNSVNSYKDPRTYRGRYDGAASNRIFVNGALALNDTKSTYFLTSNLVNFNKTFGEHQLSAIVGQEYSRTHSENVSVSAYNTPYPGERNLGAFLTYGTWINKLTGTPAIPSSTAPVDKASFSVFSEVNDNYKSKYFASASIRRDASTNFGLNNRNGTFYAVSGGWLITGEEFMQNVKAVSNLKLRASYGTSGREAGADYLNFTTYSDAVFYNTTTTSGSTINRLGNDNITWETTYTTNLGLDIGLFKRVNLSIDLYDKDSKNLLQNVALPSYVGFSSQYRNVGEIRNRGIDLQLNTENIRSKDFSWTMNFNISFNKNKLVSIKGDSLIDGYSGSYYRYVGDDINTLKAIKYVGVNPANGRPQFERIMPNGQIQIVDSIALVKADRLRGFQDIGSATPKFFGGWTNNFRYKNFNLSLLFNFSYGNKIMNNAVRSFVSPTAWQAGFNIPQPNSAIRFWQGPGDTDANYPNFYDLAFDQRGGININSSLLYVDASYARLRNVRLGYDIPTSVLKKIHLGSLNIYASMDNVFVIKSKDLFASDPEGATIGGTSNAYSGTGVASGMPRRFVVGLNAGF